MQKMTGVEPHKDGNSSSGQQCIHMDISVEKSSLCHLINGLPEYAKPGQPLGPKTNYDSRLLDQVLRVTPIFPIAQPPPLCWLQRAWDPKTSQILPLKSMIEKSLTPDEDDSPSAGAWRAPSSRTSVSSLLTQEKKPCWWSQLWTHASKAPLNFAERGLILKDHGESRGSPQTIESTGNLNQLSYPSK